MYDQGVAKNKQCTCITSWGSVNWDVGCSNELIGHLWVLVL